MGRFAAASDPETQERIASNVMRGSVKDAVSSAPSRVTQPTDAPPQVGGTAISDIYARSRPEVQHHGGPALTEGKVRP
jgi:hypothetical protein